MRRALWVSTLCCLASGAAFAQQGNVDLTTTKDTARGPHAKPAPGRVIPAPPPPTGEAPESVTVVLGPEYRAAFWRRLFAGWHYRDLWVTPIRLPVLDLEHFGGGLTPVEHGGGLQTVSLHVKGADGVEYDLRSINKAPKVPDELKGTVVEQVVADQTSASNPAGVPIAARLEQAANVLHVEPQFYVIPDDPRLGAFRAEFAGMAAEVEGRPKSKDGEVGLEDASKITKTDKLFENLNKSQSNRVDSRGYLTARLIDFEIGDWDRDSTQWRWARFGDKGERVWKPIPLDRDWAFTRSDGLIAFLARPHRPELIIFREHFPYLLGLTYEEWDLDRRLMQDLDRRAFDSTAQWLKTVWTDSVIRDAVAAMPPEYEAKRGAFLVRALEHRRDDLPREADKYYRQEAWGADVHSTTEPLIVEVTRNTDTVLVRMRIKDAPAADPYFERSFVRGETHEIRLYLDGGPDSVVERGGGDGIKVRMIAKADGDVLVDSTSGGPGQTRLYDYGHAVRLVDAHAIGVDGRRWIAPLVPPGTFTPDVGQNCETEPGAAGGSDAGAVIGLNMTCNEYGFRREPWALSNSFTVGYASAAGGGGLDYFGQLRPVGSRELWTWHATATTSQFTWFFGYGNNTAYNPNLNNGFGESFYRARQSYFQFNPGLTLPVNKTTSLTISPFLRYWETSRLGTLVDSIKPYGVGPLGTIGGTVDARYDTRDETGYTHSGVYINFRGLGVPDVRDAEGTYGKVRATAATYLTAPESFALHPTLALRIGGEKVWGTAPFEDMAHIGAGAPGEPFSVRGYIADRFTGTAAAFGNAQVELPLFQPLILVRTTFGLLAVNDIGRVFLPGEQSSTWHDGYGGGFFIAPFSGKVTANFTLVHGTDGNRFYFGYGTGLSELPAWRAPDDDDTHDTLLEFNAHVLALAEHPRTPLCERARFLAILGGNLDEFFTVHVGEAKAWLAGKGAFEPDFTDTDGGIGARGSDVQSLIHDTMLAAKGAGSLLFRGREWFRSTCRPAFAEAGIQLLRWTELSDASRAVAERYFAEYLQPAFATPTEEFPHLPSLGLALVVAAPDDRLYVVPIPTSLPRAIALHPGAEYMAMEELVLLHASALCPAAGPDAKAFVIRITRASDTRLGKRPNGDPVSAAEALLARREVAPVVRLEVNCSMPRAIRQRLLTLFRAEAQAVGVGGATLDACDVFETDGPVVSLDALHAVASIARDDLLYPRFRARAPIPASRPIWDRLRESDVFVHFPYDAFSASIGRMLEDAADDPDVTAVRCSIYRTDRDSRVIAALARAARAGKDVAVVVELMARFDERPNLFWSKTLADAGCRVVHAPAGLKVHGKIGAVMRREDGGLATYGFVSTGNLNTGTSAHYTDFALLTARAEIVTEILAVFDELAAGHLASGYTHLLVSPTTMRGPLLSLIGREASRGEGGLIRAKLNGLDDQEIIGALYTASQAGARVDLLVRGLCTLRPGVKGRSDRITVSSIVGRFLEHGRIYAFGGGDGGACDYWIGSADWRMRNLTHRVEVAAPIVDAEARRRVEEVLRAELNDPTRWLMQSDGSYIQDRAAVSAEGTQDRLVARLAH